MNNKTDITEYDNQELILWVDNEEPFCLLKNNLNALTILINDRLIYNNNQLKELIKYLK